MQESARVAIDLGAESCRVSLLRWKSGKPSIEVIHRIPNGPVHHGNSLHWPIETIFAGLEDGLRKAAEAAPEGIASIAVDSWAWTMCALPQMAVCWATHSAIAISAP